jgi:hypothetical protein
MTEIAKNGSNIPQEHMNFENILIWRGDLDHRAINT